LLTKDHRKRPDINTILQYDFVKEVARQFLAKGGELANNFVPIIKKTELHLVKEIQELDSHIDLTGKTPKEILQIKKNAEVERNKKMMSQAVKENRSQIAGAKERKQREMQSSLDSNKYASAVKNSSVKNSKMLEKTVEVDEAFDKSMEFYGDKTLESKYENTKGKNKGDMAGTYKDYPTQTIASMNMDSRKRLIQR
jgi:hypothetical protein